MNGVKEEIIERLNSYNSRTEMLRFVDWIGSDVDKMKMLMECFFSKDLRLCQKASWPLTFVHKKQKQLFRPYYHKMVANLEHPLHDAAIRNTLRIFESMRIPEEIEGDLLEKCFEYINDPRRPGGIRAFAIKLADQICTKYPELKSELILSLEDHYDRGTKAFQSCARKVLKNK